MAGFHLVIKIWGGSAIKEWAYSAHHAVPWDIIFLGEFLQIVSGNF